MGQSSRTGAHILRFVFPDHNICTGSSALLFQATFCANVTVINEIPSLPLSPLLKTAALSPRLPEGHLFTANTIEQRDFIAGHIGINAFQSVGKKMKLLFPFCAFLSVFYHFLSLSTSDCYVSIEPSLLCLSWVALSPLLHSIALLSNLLISQSVCSSLCNGATVCQSMLMRRQHMAHSLFKLSRQTDSKPLNSPSIPSPYLPLLDCTTLIS